MKGIKERLEQYLLAAVRGPQQMERTVALEEAPGRIGSADGDESDQAQEIVRREIGFAARELLVERVHRLQVALDRLRGGDYGTCVECGEAIAPARLRALPEGQTRVRCQDRIERLGRRLEEVEAEGGSEGGSVEDDD